MQVTPQAGPQAGSQAAPLVQPNLYQLSGDGRHVTFSASGIDGRPHFSYQDAHQTLTFTGDQIRQLEGDLGLIVSVSTRQTPDLGSTSFSLLLPRVNLSSQHQIAPIRTQGITTVHRSSFAPVFDRGQLDTYTVVPLHGTATRVDF